MTTENLPKIVSKKQLRYLLSDDKMPISKEVLRTKYFTDDFIENTLGMDIWKFNRTKVFDMVDTRAIFEAFGIGKAKDR